MYGNVCSIIVILCHVLYIPFFWSRRRAVVTLVYSVPMQAGGLQYVSPSYRAKCVLEKYVERNVNEYLK